LFPVHAHLGRQPARGNRLVPAADPRRLAGGGRRDRPLPLPGAVPDAFVPRRQEEPPRPGGGGRRTPLPPAGAAGLAGTARFPVHVRLPALDGRLGPTGGGRAVAGVLRLAAPATPPGPRPRPQPAGCRPPPGARFPGSPAAGGGPPCLSRITPTG